MDSKLLEQLAARAEQKEKDRLAVKVFSVGGVDMQFHKPKQDDQLAYVEALREIKNVRDSVAVSVSLIYDCCPDLQDPELHKTLGVVDPYDTVRKLMDIGEIDDLGAELAQWIGFLPGSQQEDAAKN